MYYSYQKLGLIPANTAGDLLASQLTAITPGLITNQSRPTYQNLPAHLITQLRRDGTRDGLRSHEEAQALYDSLPDSINNLADVESVVNSPSFHAGHRTAHALGGSSDASNIAYTPSALNQSIGARTPTPDELTQAAEAVESEGFFLGNELIENLGILGAGATAPAVARLASNGAKLAGGIIRQDQAAISQSLQSFPEQLAKGATEGVTRGIPAAVGSCFGPVGTVTGLVAADFIEAATTDDPGRKLTCIAGGSAKAGIAAVLLSNPPLAAVVGVGWLAGKFFNIL